LEGKSRATLSTVSIYQVISRRAGSTITVRNAQKASSLAIDAFSPSISAKIGSVGAGSKALLDNLHTILKNSVIAAQSVKIVPLGASFALFSTAAQTLAAIGIVARSTYLSLLLVIISSVGRSQIARTLIVAPTFVEFIARSAEVTKLRRTAVLATELARFTDTLAGYREIGCSWARIIEAVVIVVELTLDAIDAVVFTWPSTLLARRMAPITMALVIFVFHWAAAINTAIFIKIEVRVA
jgi:hypothetical protein